MFDLPAAKSTEVPDRALAKQTSRRAENSEGKSQRADAHPGEFPIQFADLTPVPAHSGGLAGRGPVARALGTSGEPLDQGSLARFEPRFAHDLKRVRVHADPAAGRAAAEVGARAFAFGHHIVFAKGEHEPHSSAGAQLLAHELAHVIQQTSPAARRSLSHAECEQEARSASRGERLAEQQGRRPLEIAREPQSEPPKGSNFKPDEWKILQRARTNLKPKEGGIVGVLIAEDGRQFELQSGGGQGFSSHVEGKATAKMNELGIKKAKLLVELEPCQICDRSDYPAQTGPETPMKSTKSGQDIPRQTSKINSALQIGSELQVVGPESTGVYRGTKSPTPAGSPPKGGGGQDEPHGSPSKPQPESGSKPKQAAPKAPAEGGPEPAAPKAAPPVAQQEGQAPKPSQPESPGGTKSPSVSKPSVAEGPGTGVKPKSTSTTPAPAEPVESPKAGRPKVDVEASTGRVTVEGGWKWAGRVGTGATIALQIYGAIEMIDGAVSQIEKAQSGSVSPQVAKAIAAVNAKFIPAADMWNDKFKSWHEDVAYPSDRDWMIENGLQALLQKGDMLETLGDKLNTTYWYHSRLDDLIWDYDNYISALNPVLSEVKVRTRALYDISEAILAVIPKFPNDMAQLQFWGAYQSFHDAAQDMSRLESVISMRVYEYQQRRDKARKDRKEAAGWFNYYAPAYAKVSSKKVRFTHLSED